MAVSRSIERVTAAAQRAGLEIVPQEMPSSTRTAMDAAAACGCEVGQIVKSLVFLGKDSGRPYLLLVSGANRVDETAIAAEIGESLVRPDGRQVRELTGFAIGGIPPFGHACAMETLMDPDLDRYANVWAAAGTPHAVFNITPDALRAATGARTVRMNGAPATA